MWRRKDKGIARSGLVGGGPMTLTLTFSIISEVKRSLFHKRVILYQLVPTV